MITMQMKGIRLFPCAYDILEAFIITVLCTVLIPIRYYVMFEISIRIGVLNIHYHRHVELHIFAGLFCNFLLWIKCYSHSLVEKVLFIRMFSKLISIFGHNQSIQLKLIIIFSRIGVDVVIWGQKFSRYTKNFIPIGLYDFCNGLSGPNKSVAFNSV